MLELTLVNYLTRSQVMHYLRQNFSENSRNRSENQFPEASQVNFHCVKFSVHIVKRQVLKLTPNRSEGSSYMVFKS